MTISVIAGARPNFMKVAPLMRALKSANLSPQLIHTGQHYDAKMSGTFFEELGIPEPDVNLGVGSGSHIWQLTEMMRRLETQFTEIRPKMVVVVGDVNSTVAAAITASKLEIPVSHVEAGLRSFDRRMPEEINRLITDAISDLLFTSEPAGEENLRREGVAQEKIHPVGNIMIDTLRAHLDAAEKVDMPKKLGIKPGNYSVLTLHRPSNVDDPGRLESILRAVHQISLEMPVLFPIHPRTQGNLRKFGFDQRQELGGATLVEPQGYLAMLSLVAASRFVMTDSGGIQEETTALRIPCLTLRENTERPVTMQIGSNELVGWKTESILDGVRKILNGPARRGQVPDKWDGRTAERIADVLTKWGRGD